MACAGVQEGMEGDEVALAEQLLQRHEFDAVLLGELPVLVDVEGQDAHLEGAGALSDLLADGAEADDAERPPREVDPLETAPAALLHLGQTLPQPARAGEHQREGVLRYRMAVHA